MLTILKHILCLYIKSLYYTERINQNSDCYIENNLDFDEIFLLLNDFNI